MFELRKYREQRIEKIVTYPIVCEEEEKEEHSHLIWTLFLQ